jgi:hypothetical protein
MLIGQDFDKIHFNFLGLDLLEPNAIIGDTIIFICSIYFFIKTNSGTNKPAYFLYWKWFFIVFGVGFFLGGLGHLFYNYTGVPGKYASWYLGIFATFLIEKAMVSIMEYQRLKKTLVFFIHTKVCVAILSSTYVFLVVDLTVDPSRGLIIPTINSVIGLGLSLGVLGAVYSNKIHSSFKWLWISSLILIPSAIVQGLKINFHPWFDRNDISHIFLTVGLFYYYRHLKLYRNYLDQKLAI